MENIFESWLVNTYIAHRGLHDEESPENSLSAFEKAINKGYAIELDVRLLGDGTVVVFHDDSLSRMTGKDKYVQNITKADLKKITLLNSNEQIPTFEEVLKLVDGKVPLLIEIKNNENKVGELERNVYDLLEHYNGEFAIQSFNPYSIDWFKVNAPNFTRGILSSFFKKDKLSFAKKFALKRMILNKVCNPHFISYNYENLPNKFVNKYKTLPVIAWAIPSQQEYEKVVKYCDNIIFEGFEPKI